jgi:hypothetical protein
VDELLARLGEVKTRGKVRAIGAAGYFNEIFAIASAADSPFDVYQFDHDSSGNNMARWLEAKLPAPILFGTLSKEGAPDEKGLNPPQVSPSAPLKAALDANPEGLVLFSTTKIVHAEEILFPLRGGA